MLGHQAEDLLWTCRNYFLPATACKQRISTKNNVSNLKNGWTWCPWHDSSAEMTPDIGKWPIIKGCYKACRGRRRFRCRRLIQALLSSPLLRSGSLSGGRSLFSSLALSRLALLRLGEVVRVVCFLVLLFSCVLFLVSQSRNSHIIFMPISSSFPSHPHLHLISAGALIVPPCHTLLRQGVCVCVCDVKLLLFSFFLLLPF